MKQVSILAGRILGIVLAIMIVSFVHPLHINEAQAISGEPANIIVVAATGGDYTKLSEALIAITDASENNRYVVKVYGRIDDDAQITAKSYVDVIGYNAEVMWQGVGDADALHFENVTQTTWRNMTVRRAPETSNRFALGMYGSADSSVRFENMRFINESTGTGAKGAYITDTVQAVFYNSYFKGSDNNSEGWNDGVVTSGQARPVFSNSIFEAGNGGGVSNTGFAALMLSTPILNNSIFRGGSGVRSQGIRAEDQSAPIINGGVAFGGSGTNSIGVHTVFNPAPVINGLTVHNGNGSGAKGVWLAQQSSPVLSNILVAPEQLPQLWVYNPDNEGRFQPFSDKPYMLSTIMVGTQRVLPEGTRLRLGTTPGGNEIAEPDIGGVAGTKYFSYNRVEVEDGGYLYATPSIPLNPHDFEIYYVVIVNYPDSTALIVDTTGYPSINNSVFISNGASNALFLNAEPQFDIRNSVFNTLDPANQYALFVSQPTTNIPIYNSQFVGGFYRVISFAPQSFYTTLDLNGNRITNLGAPTASTDATRQAEIDAVQVIPGPAGPQGEAGAPGPHGLQGEQGAPGETPSIISLYIILLYLALGIALVALILAISTRRA